MNNEITLRFDTTGVDWTLAADIMQRAPLSSREPHKLEKAFGNSDLVCFAWHGDDLVGMARALSDGVYQSVIYDLCMLPDYQGKHLGTRMIQAIIKRLATPNVVLWAVPGKEGFYARFGFKPMLTAMALVENPERTAGQGYILL
ncbi:GNAT family N-acetyltransferase [uncultured Pseudodesulfovibrio sp.]|uniref:GNAT family N-acetyltransferase n=1 Tax=uncultured Pseudodesulfovibrio sp. TaxID=2035858 RepID=UPI0029C8C35A|nr:GNAT family N-acetyltransferase [uncultured Pseudodesulfovibrio sp.]